MKVSKSLLAVIAMAGTMGFSAVASAMDFSVYGSLRGGLNQSDTDDRQIVSGAAIETDADGNLAVTVDSAGLVAGGLEKGVSLGDPTKYGTIETYDVKAADFVAGGKVESADAQLELGHGFAGSRIGVKGSEDLGNGAEAGLHWETAIGGKGDLAENGRHANVWYSGAFGKITIGQQNNPYRSAANWDQSWWLGGANRYGDGGSRLQGVRYDGEAGAFNFSVMANADSSGNDFAASERQAAVLVYGTEGAPGGAANACTPDAAGLDIGSVISGTQANNTADCAAGYLVEYGKVESETGVDSWIATGHYDMGVATINLGYRVNNNEAQYVGQSWDNFVISANGSLDALDWYVAFENNTDNSNVKAGGVVLIEDAAGAAINDATNQADNTAANTSAISGATSDIHDALTTAHDTTTIGLFLGYNLSDVSKIYFEWEDSANDGLDVLGENLDKTSTLLGFSRKIGPNTAFIAEYASSDYNSELTADSSTLQGYLKVDF